MTSKGIKEDFWEDDAEDAETKSSFTNNFDYNLTDEEFAVTSTDAGSEWSNSDNQPSSSYQPNQNQNQNSQQFHNNQQSFHNSNGYNNNQSYPQNNFDYNQNGYNYNQQYPQKKPQYQNFDYNGYNYNQQEQKQQFSSSSSTSQYSSYSRQPRQPTYYEDADQQYKQQEARYMQQKRAEKIRKRNEKEEERRIGNLDLEKKRAREQAEQQAKAYLESLPKIMCPLHQNDEATHFCIHCNRFICPKESITTLTYIGPCKMHSVMSKKTYFENQEKNKKEAEKAAKDKELKGIEELAEKFDSNDEKIVKKKSDIQQIAGNVACFRHGHKKASHFCFDCNKYLCSVCCAGQDFCMKHKKIDIISYMLAQSLKKQEK